jgi:hypothetical protein
VGNPPLPLLIDDSTEIKTKGRLRGGSCHLLRGGKEQSGC